MSIYIVDSNFFIQAHRATYPIDVVPGFWNKIRMLGDENKIISIDKVKNEIFLNEDDLTAWIRDNLAPSFFKDSATPEVLECYRHVVEWANTRSTHYQAGALNNFLEANCADAWLVAYAVSLNTDRYLVTQEISQPDRKSAIKIPEVCRAFNIQYLNMIEMFRRLNETF